MAKKVTAETIIKQQVKDYLRFQGWMDVYNLASQGSYKGLADMTIIKNGRVVQVEVKTPKGKQSPLQVKFQKDWEYNGGEYWIIRSFDDIVKMTGGLQ